MIGYTILCKGVVENYKLNFDMAAKVTPTKSYLCEFGDACRLCSSNAYKILRDILQIEVLTVIYNL